MQYGNRRAGQQGMAAGTGAPGGYQAAIGRSVQQGPANYSGRGAQRVTGNAYGGGTVGAVPGRTTQRMPPPAQPGPGNPYLQVPGRQTQRMPPPQQVQRPAPQQVADQPFNRAGVQVVRDYRQPAPGPAQTGAGGGGDPNGGVYGGMVQGGVPTNMMGFVPPSLSNALRPWAPVRQTGFGGANPTGSVWGGKGQGAFMGAPPGQQQNDQTRPTNRVQAQWSSGDQGDAGSRFKNVIDEKPTTIQGAKDAWNDGGQQNNPVVYNAVTSHDGGATGAASNIVTDLAQTIGNTTGSGPGGGGGGPGDLIQDILRGLTSGIGENVLNPISDSMTKNDMERLKENFGESSSAYTDMMNAARGIMSPEARAAAEKAARDDLYAGVSDERDTALRRLNAQAGRGGRISSGAETGITQSALDAMQAGERGLAQDAFGRNMAATQLGISGLGQGGRLQQDLLDEGFTSNKELAAMLLGGGEKASDLLAALNDAAIGPFGWIT